MISRCFVRMISFLNYAAICLFTTQCGSETPRFIFLRTSSSKGNTCSVGDCRRQVNFRHSCNQGVCVIKQCSKDVDCPKLSDCLNQTCIEMGACVDQSDCPAEVHAVCKQGQCQVTRCEKNRDCDKGEECQNGVCQEQKGGQNCMKSQDCPQGEFCMSSRCVPFQEVRLFRSQFRLCQYHLDCPHGQRCGEAGSCVAEEKAAVEPCRNPGNCEGQGCQGDEDCPVDRSCVAGWCHKGGSDTFQKEPSSLAEGDGIKRDAFRQKNHQPFISVRDNDGGSGQPRRIFRRPPIGTGENKNRRIDPQKNIFQKFHIPNREPNRRTEHLKHPPHRPSPEHRRPHPVKESLQGPSIDFKEHHRRPHPVKGYHQVPSIDFKERHRRPHPVKESHQGPSIDFKEHHRRPHPVKESHQRPSIDFKEHHRRPHPVKESRQRPSSFSAGRHHRRCYWKHNCPPGMLCVSGRCSEDRLAPGGGKPVKKAVQELPVPRFRKLGSHKARGGCKKDKDCQGKYVCLRGQCMKGQVKETGREGVKKILLKGTDSAKPTRIRKKEKEKMERRKKINAGSKKGSKKEEAKNIDLGKNQFSGSYEEYGSFSYGPPEDLTNFWFRSSKNR